MATRLTDNFTLEEFTDSATAKAKHIDNTPLPAIVINLLYLAQHIMQPLRQKFNMPIAIGSGYRCPQLNKAVGGVDNSQHMTGEACDICLPLLPNGKQDLETGKAWFAYIRDFLQFDQLIWEHNAKGSYWIHVSFKKFGKNRKQVIDNLLKK